MSQLKLAILGAGRIAETMAETVRQMDDVCLYAVAAREEARAKAFAETYGAEHYYGSYEEMLQDDGVELVYIATPHSHHAQHAKLCIEYGLSLIHISALRGSLVVTIIFSIIGSFQLFNEPTILSKMVGNSGITNYYTPNIYVYNLAFTGSQQGYAAALAIVMAIITIAIAYVVQIKGLKDTMKQSEEG